MVNTHGLMRLGAIQRIADIEKELDELRAIVRAPAQPTEAAYRTTKRPKHQPLTPEQRDNVEAGKRAYKRKHWTQRPENQARMRKLLRKATRARMKARKRE